MRELENLCTDFEAAVIVTTQGTKSSAEGMLLTLDKIGGSAGKFQVAHMVMTLNRTQQDAEDNLAELFIPKNREGKSGNVFRIKLNNGKPKIEIEGSYEVFYGQYEKQRQQEMNIHPEEYMKGILQNQ
jgi:hypothetical protein